MSEDVGLGGGVPFGTDDLLKTAFHRCLVECFASLRRVGRKIQRLK